MSGMISKQEFGVMEQVDKAMLDITLEKEKALDKQLKGEENLDEDDFEYIRQKRKLQLQKMARQRQDWLQLGHGR
jgi:hypothetical protein